MITILIIIGFLITWVLIGLTAYGVAKMRSDVSMMMGMIYNVRRTLDKL
jgi:hypothetical protein